MGNGGGRGKASSEFRICDKFCWTFWKDRLYSLLKEAEGTFHV
jgi:hypothetical protein